MYWMTGKWENSGDRMSGSPYQSFRYTPNITGYKITAAASWRSTAFRKHGGRDKVMVEGVQETPGDGWCSRNIDKNFKIRLA
ncbi:hypothetical protein IW262DRAFT_1454759 [Armillaria fumosa]|nr:hypothetical protein IW262DRAFT_1454759 [Armillaria fumosa]